MIKQKYLKLIGFIVLAVVVGIVTYLTFKSENKQTAYSEKPNQNVEQAQQIYSTPDVVNQGTNHASVNEVASSDGLVPENLYLVGRVIDGDTIKLSTGESVRLIGIDATELGQPYSEEAKNYLKNLVEGRKVILEKDVSEYDKYGRLLRYVYLPLEDNNYLFVNQEMVLQGLAYAWTLPPDIKYSDDILNAQEQAQAENKALWE